MRNHIITALKATVATLVATNVAVAQNFAPVTLTPSSYSVDIVVEKTATPSLPLNITATQGGGTSLGDATWYEIGFRLRPYNTTNGLPHPGTTITDLGNSHVQYTMPPSYSTNDVFFVDGGVSTATITLNTPTIATNLSLLGSSGNGATTVNYVVNHADASTETGTLTFPDWFNGTPFAYTTSGRVSAAGGTDNEGATNPRLYSQAIPVGGTSPVTSIDLSYNGGGGHVAIFGISGNASGPAWTPILVNGFNQDIIAEAMQPLPVNATMDQGTNLVGTAGQNTWFEQGYNTAHPGSGLPPAGSTFTSLSQPTHTYQMAPSYTANDAILIDTNHRVTNITPATPANFSAFTILTAGGNIGANNTMTNKFVMQHADGTSETNLFFGYDWFNTVQPVAFNANGRVNIGTPSFNDIDLTSGQQPRLFESVFGLANTGSPVTNIVVVYDTAPNTSSTTYIMAISAASGAVTPVINSQPLEVNAFTGNAATFNVLLSAGTPPLSFQWQKDGVNLVDGGNIVGSTSSNLVVSGVSAADAGNYQLIITNISGSTSSRIIPLTPLSRLPDVTAAGDPVTAYDPYGGSSPAGADASFLIDNTTTSYQDYGANTPAGTLPFIGPVGFVVTPTSGASVVTGLRIYTATTAAVDDPTDYTLEGSTDGVNFTGISSGSLSLLDARNNSGQALDPTHQILTELEFANSSAYTSYRLYFTDVKDINTADSLRVGEVELLGTYSATLPAILNDLQNLAQTNYVGTPVNLSIQASGTPPLSYQWLQDGSAITGATNASYPLLTLGGGHTYECTVTNNYGFTNSLTAAITGISLDSATTFAVNFHDYANFAALDGSGNYTEYVPYVGQGAYNDASNNVWNGYGDAFTTGITAVSSAGIGTPIIFSIVDGGDNGAIWNFDDNNNNNSLQGTPGFLLGQGALVNNGNTGTFTFTNVPAGNYDLYAYGANYDGDRGARITMGGVIQLINNDPNISGQHPPTNFVSGVTYVVFHNLTPTNSAITGIWDGNLTNPNTGQSGEGDLCGLQLVRVSGSAAQPLLTIQLSGTSTIISWSPTNGTLQSATSVAGTYTDIGSATSPYTNTVSGTQQFFRVKVQ